MTPSFSYTPLEREPYDALCDRYLRAVEMAVRYFRTLERSKLAINSESYRDLRNRIAHDYLPDQLAEIYALIVDAYGPELIGVRIDR